MINRELDCVPRTKRLLEKSPDDHGNAGVHKIDAVWVYTELGLPLDPYSLATFVIEENGTKNNATYELDMLKTAIDCYDYILHMQKLTKNLDLAMYSCVTKGMKNLIIWMLMPSCMY